MKGKEANLKKRRQRIWFWSTLDDLIVSVSVVDPNQ